MTSYSIEDHKELANGRSQLEPDIDWKNLFEESVLKQLEEYCWAHHTELEYVIVPYFVMSGAITGKETKVRYGFPKSGRTNLYLLMGGNPASGKSSGFELAVNQPKVEIEKILGFSAISSDLSRTALLSELQQQTVESRPFLIIASDEMGLSLNGEAKDSKEWELKRVIYNNSFSGTDIVSERMQSSSKIKEVKIQNPHLTIIGMTQPKPLFTWIRNVVSNEDGLLERYLIWIVKQSPSSKIVKPEEVTIASDWPTQCLVMLTKYHQENRTKQYIISFELYKKVNELEMKTSQLSLLQWNRFLQILHVGNEEEAVQFRRNTNMPAIRYSELVLRFAVGLHVGCHGLKKFLAGEQIDEIPEHIDERIIDFSMSAVKRCLNQVLCFRAEAKRFSASAKQSKQISRSQACKCHPNSEAKSENLQKQKTQNQLSTTGGKAQESQNIGQQSEYQAQDGQNLQQIDANLLASKKEEEFNSNLFRKVVTFPAPYFVPRVICQCTKGATSKAVLKMFTDVTQNPSNAGYLGELVKIKPNPRARRPYIVFFRAPYEKVDQKLLKKYNISQERYEQMLTTKLGGTDCKLRKEIETEQTTWEQFHKICSENYPFS